MASPRSSTPRPNRPGIFANLSAYLGALLGHLRLRLQLAGLEAKEAAIHFAILLALVVMALVVIIFAYFFICFGLVFSIAALIGTKHAWIWATFGMGLLHLLGAGACLFIAKTRLSKPVFPATLEEFKKDQEWLKTANRS